MGSAPKPGTSRQLAKQPDISASGYHTVAPYLIVPRAAQFIEFLVSTFAGTERIRVPRGEGSDVIMHAEVTIGDSTIELAEAYEKIPMAPQAIHLYVDNADETYDRALRAGASPLYPPGDHPSGDRQGAVRDSFGNIWYIAEAKPWRPDREGIRAVQPYLHLRGADRMIVFLEKAFGAKVRGHVPKSADGKVLHATIQIGDNTLELDEAHGEFQPMPCHRHLHVADADATYAQALAAGATSVEVPKDKPYGRSGGVKDSFGNNWYMTSELGGT